MKSYKPKAKAKKKADPTTYNSLLGWTVKTPKPAGEGAKRFLYTAEMEDDGSESVYLFPPDLAAEEVKDADEAAFRKMGAVKVEAMPKAKLGDVKDPLNQVAADMTQAFKDQGLKVASQKGRTGSFKSVKLTVKARGMTHLILEGKQFIFILRTGYPAILPQIVKTIKETAAKSPVPGGLPPGVELPEGMKGLPGMTGGDE